MANLAFFLFKSPALDVKAVEEYQSKIQHKLMDAPTNNSTSGLKLARTILGVLRNYTDGDFGLYDDAFASVKNTQDFECSLLDYNLARSPAIELPEMFRDAAPNILKHIEFSSVVDPWGLIEKDVVALKLIDSVELKSGRILLFSRAFIDKLLAKLFPRERITPAEQKTLLQSLSGLSMREAAEQDSVSYETKKSQLKSVFRKTDFNNQQTLSAFLITHLTLEVVAKESRQSHSAAESDAAFFQYVDNYMGEYVRASVVQESTLQRFRIIELGDPAGTPVVCVHHLGLINFSPDEIDEIKRNKIRLICPLRHGALGPVDEEISTTEHIAHAIEGINVAVALTGAENAPIIGLLSGGLYVIEYLKRFPKSVNKLIFLGASYKSAQNKVSRSSFKHNLHQLADSRSGVFERTVNMLIDNVDDADNLKTVMKESHNYCAADVDSIDALFADVEQVNAMQARLKTSGISIVQDLKMQAETDWSSLSNREKFVPVHFLHGNRDTLIPLSDIQQLVDSQPEFHLHTIDGAGNWIFGKYTKTTAQIVSSILHNGC